MQIVKSFGETFRYFVDADGQYIGRAAQNGTEEVRDAQDNIIEMRVITPGSEPRGAVTEVPGPPDHGDQRWTGRDWTPPPPPDPLDGMTARKLAELLIANGAITPADLTPK